MARAKQDGLLFQRHAVFLVGEHALDHELGLGRIVLNRHKRGLFGGGSIGPNVLGEPFLGKRDHRVGGGKDWHRGAVIPVERDDRGGRIELVREIENVADCGGAEAIDRLGIVADHRQTPPIRFEREEDRCLDGVGILIFIHQYVVEQGAHFVREFGHLHQFGPMEKKIVVVEDMLTLLGLEGCSFIAPRPRSTCSSSALSVSRFSKRSWAGFAPIFSRIRRTGSMSSLEPGCSGICSRFRLPTFRRAASATQSRASASSRTSAPSSRVRR